MNDEAWPALPLAEWEQTYATLHMWMQIVGKVVLATTPKTNHWWNLSFQLTPTGMTTPTLHSRERNFRIEFDFIKHQLVIPCDSGQTATIALAPTSVADFYRKLMSTLNELGVAVRIWPVPVEVPNPVPFEQNFHDSSYDGEYANRLWRILSSCDRVFNEFRAGFIGKCSPVHFFWGSFDLAVTRFSGRRAPEREGADIITREAYSHEVISHGFWPGQRGGYPGIAAPAFYSYAAPEPAGFEAARVPAPAYYSSEMKEWILLYDDVRKSAAPERLILDFMQSTYDAAADLAGWDRESLERHE
jgi:hypothetical protein